MGCKRDNSIFLQINWKPVLSGERFTFLSNYTTATQSPSLSNMMDDATFTNAENKAEVTDSKWAVCMLTQSYASLRSYAWCKVKKQISEIT